MDEFDDKAQSVFQWKSAVITAASNNTCFTIKNTFICLESPPTHEMEDETRRSSSCPTTPWFEQALTPSQDMACQLKDYAHQLRNTAEYAGCSYQTVARGRCSDEIYSGEARAQFQWSSAASSSGLKQSQGLATYLHISPSLPCINDRCCSRSLPSSPYVLISGVGLPHSPRHVSKGAENDSSATKRSEPVDERVRQDDSLIHSGCDFHRVNRSAFDVRFGCLDIDDKAFQVRFGSYDVDSTN